MELLKNYNEEDNKNENKNEKKILKTKINCAPDVDIRSLVLLKIFNK